VVRVERSIVIRRPIEDVYSFAVSPETVSQWSAVPLEAKRLSGGSFGAGSTAHFVATFLSRRISATFEVTEYQPARRFVAKATSGPFPIVNIMRFEPLGPAETRMTQTIEAEPGGFLKIAEPILVRLGGRRLQKSLANLKNLLERPPSGPPGRGHLAPDPRPGPRPA
jgi:polyketide cyclase/dehydrase/lipid transport protein